MPTRNRASNSISRKFKEAKRFGLIILAFMFLIALPSPAVFAEDASPFGSVLKFTGGVVSAFLIHETSHALVAAAMGKNLSWKAGNYNQPISFTESGLSDAQGVALYSAGLLSQVAGAEIILRSDRIDKNSSYVRGMMTWDIINPILYSLDYWFFHISNKDNGNSYQGDLQGIEHYSNQTIANGFALSFCTLALWQGYRFLQTQTWAPDWLKSETQHVSLLPLASGGIFMKYRVEF
jgi:hypothetical protein